MVFDEDRGQRIYLKAESEGANAEAWQSFHFANRLKLEKEAFSIRGLVDADWHN
jgi:hypothetical protein